MASFFARAGDTGPPIERTLTDGNDDAVDLAGAQVRFIMRERLTRSVKIAAGADNLQITDGSDGTKGKVRYGSPWLAAETAMPGDFLGEWEVTFADGHIETFPNIGYEEIVFSGDLD